MAIALECSQCGRKFKVSDEGAGKKVRCPNEECTAVCVVPNPNPNDEWDSEDYGDLSVGPIRPKRRKKADDEENSGKPRKSKKKKSKNGSGIWPAIATFLSTNQAFLLTWVVPAFVIMAVIIVVGVSMGRAKAAAEARAQLASSLGGKVRNLSQQTEDSRYIRGKLAILEVGRPGSEQYELNDHIEPPMNAVDDIGSVIVVEWKKFEGIYMDQFGRPLYMQGRPNDPVALISWNCRVKLVDLKRKVVVYQTSLAAPEKHGESGKQILITPTTSVTADQLAAEFDKIKAFQSIGNDDDPPRK